MLDQTTSASDLLPQIPAPAPGPDDNRKYTRDFDKALGARVKILRKLRNISQDQLARDLGLTFQQVQKYESGANRFPIARLVRTAQLLDCTAAFLIGDEQSETTGLLTAIGRRTDVAAILPRLVSKTPDQVRAVARLLDTMPDSPSAE